ncbi:hypothetical protein CTM76_03625 [Photobacterium phosphoreum]|uniref:hypothetical protein n=1 Tax=Photobacterium phosphoreum TaxID=659 RepID=UPI0007F91E82|nr:hypothetical protein [Photobacterium phosphoreum]OBU34871.1 hypothetical protein AYY25_19940 [Photobacterium phosphoreum]PSU80363.1 hypothetical protein CTM76_03625 [Photobacterium phosphoreum]
MKRSIQVEITEKELLKFENISGISWKIKGSYSRLFLADLIVFNQLFGVGSDEIFMILNNYENGINHAGIKSPSAFRYHPLKGLLHIHFSASVYIAQNIKLGLGKNGLKQIINETLNKEDLSPEQQSVEIAKRMVDKTLIQRRSDKKMTGEWVVYTKYQGKNYYLCLARHNDNDQSIRNRIEEHCLNEFPFLRSILSNS